MKLYPEKIEAGQTEDGSSVIYIDGLPIGPVWASSGELSLAFAWLAEGGARSLIEQQLNKVQSMLTEYVECMNDADNSECTCGNAPEDMCAYCSARGRADAVLNLLMALLPMSEGVEF